MALVTLCPSCGTTFRISPGQLQAQNGLVRCGNCQVIFNGFATLITIDESEIECLSTPVEKAITSEIIDDFRVSEDVLHALHHQPETNAATSVLVGHVQDEAEKLTQSHDYLAGVESASSQTSLEHSASNGDFLSGEMRQRSPQHWGWKFGNTALLILLASQLIHAYRADLAILAPQTRPYLEQYCKILDCSVPLPKNIQLLSIASSDIEIRDPEHQPHVATLTAIIRNHASFAQALPDLILFLTDMHNQLLASRIFTATDYLSIEQKKTTAIQPNQEIIIQLHLDNSQLKSTGYRLKLLYL